MENLGAGVVVVFVKTAAVKRSGYLFVQSKYLKCLNNLRSVAVIFLKPDLTCRPAARILHGGGAHEPFRHLNPSVAGAR